VARLASRLLDPIKVGELEFANRIVMAPLTRCRATEGDVPTAMNGRYYAQRATAGFIISEATNVSPRSCAFEKAPGIYSSAQVSGWKIVSDAVHAAGGRIFLQLWHCGRVGAEGILHGYAPLSPSGINDDLTALQVWGQLANGRYVQIAATPSRAMTIDEIRAAVQDYRLGAANALSAGCDGVEVHAANGYLPHQFLSPTINRRDDEYGGSVANRARFLRQILENIAQVVPMSRVGVRLSPYAAYNNVRDPNPQETYTYVTRMLQELGVAYIHLADTNAMAGGNDLASILDIVRPIYDGPLIANGGIDVPAAEALVGSDKVQMIAFGRLFIANPDLPHRIRLRLPLAQPRALGWYGGNEEGYTDYSVCEPDAATSR
jgi:N-ethylmaleimide reductase